MIKSGNTKGGSMTVLLTSCFDWFGISCMITDNFCFYLQNRLTQTSQTRGQRYSDTQHNDTQHNDLQHTDIQHNIHTLAN